jgi:PAS domain S-box-containing protein
MENSNSKNLFLDYYKSDELFKKFFDNAPLLCYMISPNGLIIDVNKIALETLGYKKEELISKPLEIIYAPESRRKMEELFESWNITGELRNEELTILTKNGSKRIILLNVSSIKDKNGNILSSVSIQEDITERKENEGELKKKIIELENLNQFMVEREFTMIKLKEEINELCNKLGEENRY